MKADSGGRWKPWGLAIGYALAPITLTQEQLTSAKVREKAEIVSSLDLSLL